MLITIPDVLTAAQVNHARQRLSSAEWVDGRVTAGYQSAQAKDNLQIPEGSPVAQEIGDLPAALLERIEHYFATYKLVPDEPPRLRVSGRYGYAAAAEVIRAAIEDYAEMFGGMR